MISVRDVAMDYPVPKRYRDFVLRPFSRRGTKRALSGVSLEIRKGERVGFLGPNGAGKTTLLKLIGGLLLPTAGQITVNGYPTGKNNDAVRASCSVVMNEERSFYWRLTGAQNLEFFGVLQNLTGARLRARVRDALEVVGLTESADQRVGTYSAGMKQRLAIARGLLAEAPVLILDEPTRALDPQGAEDTATLLLTTLHAHMDKTLLIATHRLEEARVLCSRLCVLSHGAVKADAGLEVIDERHASLIDFYKETVSRMNLRLLSAKMGAFVKRDFIIASSYRLNFVLNAFYSLFIVTLLFFIGGMVDPGTRGLGEYGGSYFAFAVIGYGFYQYFNLSLSTFSSAVQREQLTGCLEAMVGTQTRPETSILLSSLYALLSSLLELAVILVAGFLVFGVEIRSVNIASTALAFVLSIGVFTAFGILSAAFIIVLKKGDPLSWLFTTLNFILGGAFFPIEQMPDWMRSIARFVPATYSLRALRAGILNGQGIAELAVPLLVLAAIAAVMLPLSLFLFRRAVWKAKREGTLVLY